MNQCDICAEMYGNERNCNKCILGNPCLSCGDYDETTNTCKSDGGCGKDNKN